MYKQSSWRMSKYKKLAIALAVVGSSGYLLTPTNVTFAAANDIGYDDEVFPPEYLDLDQFVITADRTPVNKWTTPSNVITITDKDIEANHYQTLAEALNHVNGIIVPVGSNIPIINGFEKVLILIDGHRLYNDGVEYRDTVELSAIPSMKNIKRIEIVKGGGSALYGSAAVSGIINIITKKGERNETTIDFNSGSWHQHNYTVTNQGLVGDFGWFITGDLHESNPYSYPGNVNFMTNNDVTYSDRNDRAFTGRFDYKFDDRNSLTLSGHHIFNKYGQFIKNYNDNHNDSTKYMKYTNISLVYNFKENSQTPGWLRYFNDSKFRDGYYRYKDPRSFKGISKFRVQGVDYQNSWMLGVNKIVTGVEWHQISTSHYSWDREKKTLYNRALYLQDTVNVGKKWKFLPGLRYDDNSEFGHQLSPKIAANYRADEKTKIYASWGRVFNAATPFQLYANTSSAKGNSNLKPEKGHTGILGMEREFGSNISMNLNFFYANLKDAIDIDDNDNFTNLNEQKSRGVEATLKQKIDDNWSFNVGYNFTRFEGIDELDDSFVQPRNTYRVGFHYNKGIWNANLLGIMGYGGLSSGKYFDSSKYAIVDFNIGCNVNENTTVYFKANNLTNQNYSYYGKSYDDDGEISYSYHSPGRSFIVGAEIKF